MLGYCVFICLLYIRECWRLAICDSRNKHSLTSIQHWLINRFKLNWRRFAPQTSKNFYNTRTFQSRIDCNRICIWFNCVQSTYMREYRFLPVLIECYLKLHSFQICIRFMMWDSIFVIAKFQSHAENFTIFFPLTSCQFVRIKSHHYFYCFFFSKQIFNRLTKRISIIRKMTSNIENGVNLDRFNRDKSRKTIHSRFEYWIGIYGGYLDFGAF